MVISMHETKHEITNAPFVEAKIRVSILALVELARNNASITTSTVNQSLTGGGM